MTDITLYTHSGPAHADEAFAVAALTILYPNARLERTRDLQKIYAAMGDPNAFFLDIGGSYNPAYNQFDHHQPEGAGFRDKAQVWPYATAGLVWKTYGTNVVRRLHPELSKRQTREVAWRVDASVLRYIDAVDCGIAMPTAGPSLSAVIASFNTAWPKQEDGEEKFPYMRLLCQALLENFIDRFSGKVLARAPVRAGTRAFDGRVLILEDGMPWGEIVTLEMPDVLLVVSPTNGSNHWHIRCVEERHRHMRTKLPPAWGGLEYRELSAIAGQGAIFCHRALHLAGAESKEAALVMAGNALQWHDEHTADLFPPGAMPPLEAGKRAEDEPEELQTEEETLYEA